MKDDYVCEPSICARVGRRSAREARAKIGGVRGGQRVTFAGYRSHLPGASKFGNATLTEAAEQGKLAPGDRPRRGIRRASKCLLPHENNPVLIGEPGTARPRNSRSLAQRIVDGDVSRRLESKRGGRSTSGALLAGAKLPRRVRKERAERRAERDQEKNDQAPADPLHRELHTIVGAGAAEGAVRRREHCLKRMLCPRRAPLASVRRRLANRKYIEKDAALERRFQPIFVVNRSVRHTIGDSCAASSDRMSRITVLLCVSATRRSSPRRCYRTATFGPVPARQGDSTSSRGCVTAADGDRPSPVELDESRAARAPARDRARRDGQEPKAVGREGSDRALSRGRQGVHALRRPLGTR